jgi:hypothetical protein
MIATPKWFFCRLGNEEVGAGGKGETLGFI